MMNWLFWWLPKPVAPTSDPRLKLACDIVSCGDWSDIGDIAYALEDEGFKVLGYGMNGIVLNYEGHAVKFFHSDDFAYLTFVDVAMSHPSPYFPEIYSLERISEAAYAVAMESLEDFDAFYDDDYYYNHIRGAVEYDTISKRANKELSETLRLLIAMRKGISRLGNDVAIWADLHDKNVMLRGNQMVITDPWC